MITARFTNEQITAALHKHHGLVAHAADDLGMTREYLHLRIQKTPQLQAVLASARERMTDIAESSLYTRIIEGDAWAVSFYLKTQGKDRGYVERAEIDITTVVRQAAIATGLDPDQAERAAEAILALK